MQGITRIDLLRHGETQGVPGFRGSTDVPLTDNGFDQMKAATNGEGRWDRVITSPLQRCADFATAFARRHSLPLTFDERIKEIHFGAWEGRTATDLMAEDPEAVTRFWTDPGRHPPPGGEPLTRFQARVLAGWNDIVNRCTGTRVLVVTHGGVIRTVICHVLQRPIDTLLELDVRHGALYTFRVCNDAETTPTAKLMGSI